MKLNAYVRIIAVLIAVPVAACGSLTGTGDQYWLKDEGPRFPSTDESLAAYHAYVWNLTAAEWARESERVHGAVGRDQHLFQRVREAIVAAAPAAPQREHARAQQLLEQCEREAQNAPSLKALIALLRDELAERRRLEDRLRDETRRADEADQKLGALKAIELNLLERGRPAGNRKP